MQIQKNKTIFIKPNFLKEIIDWIDLLNVSNRHTVQRDFDTADRYSLLGE